MQLVRANAEDLRRLLDAERADADREAREERAGIMEFCGGLTRAEAERRAFAGDDNPLSVQPAALSQRGADGNGTRAREDDGAASEVEPGRAVERWPLAKWGDLRPCTRCLNLTRSGRCLAAWNGLLRAARDYEPSIPEQPRRCIGYAPPADDPEQSPGIERWPELAAWQQRLTDKEIQEVALSQRGPL